MKTYAALLALTALVGTAAVSHAAQKIVSTSMRTGTNTAGACYIRNAGKSQVVLTEAEMSQNGFPMIINVNNCNGATLAPGQTCVIIANDLPDDVPFQCSATSAGSAKYLRGIVELRAITGSGLRVILADELR